MLSPGITPALVGVFAVELPLALTLGYLLGGRQGFGIALALSAFLLGGIKLFTDLSDPYDASVAALALVAGGTVIVQATGHFRRSTRALGMLVGLLAIPYGLTKIGSDFFDPFDLFLADMAIALGGWLLWESWWAFRTPLAFRRKAAICAGADLAALTWALWENGVHGWIGWTPFLALAVIVEGGAVGGLLLALRKAETGVGAPAGPVAATARKD